MANEQNDQQDKEQEAQPAFPTIPMAMEHRLSMKWLTMEALSKLIKRFGIDGTMPRVVLLTAFGKLEGTLCEIKPTYAESYSEEETGELRPDVASMVTHVRSDLLALMEQEEQGLQLVDTAPILSLRDVALYNHGQKQHLPQLTLFADQVIGFSLTELPRLH
ncbi:hypothetical protein CIG75_08880 [Tumebacillus algifaecis]|uniref:Uncharacterized protein n=1 Tax=Tumebacillus algifaecis TaxID=1214604 RepID=A0A223D0E7_9BACL|nr:hypothetical protein [Tumebacillus algifaecis]ASS75080.1 hypothetical protein CIG75_08880 [Tumebacillus algifaecis]